MGQKHFTLETRETLQRCFALGFSLRMIGRITGYSPAAISKERKRNAKGRQYDAIFAQTKAYNRRHNVARHKRKLCRELEEYIFEKMKEYWSPEEISGRLKMDYPNNKNMHISFKSIYRILARGVDKRTKWVVLAPFLRLKRRGKSLRRHAPYNLEPKQILPSIEERPEIVNERGRVGDWESDLICGPKGKGCIATFVERKTGYLCAAECPSQKPFHYQEAALEALGHIPKAMLRTITVDRGIEFRAYREIERLLDVQYYFCHPYAPYERGLNEQTNGLLRQFFPKGKLLLGITEDLAKAVELINNRPRKRLGYKTPVEILKKLGVTEC